jgi:predicted nucleic acid-binding protein
MGDGQHIRTPPRAALRRIATVAPEDQTTTSINLGELICGATLATGNARHFEEIPGLAVEDWLVDSR